MKKILFIISIGAFFNTYAGVREKFYEVEGVIKSFDEQTIIVQVGKKRVAIPRLKEFEKNILSTKKQFFLLDAKKYKDYIAKIKE